MTLITTIERRSAGRKLYTRETYIPPIPDRLDPDAVRLVNEYRICYGWARILKCLSFGLKVKPDLLAWAAGYDESSQSGVQNAVYQLKRRLPWFDVEFVAGWNTNEVSGYQIIRDDVLTRIRADMRGEA
jgi:hypothetical protein